MPTNGPIPRTLFRGVRTLGGTVTQSDTVSNTSNGYSHRNCATLDCAARLAELACAHKQLNPGVLLSIQPLGRSTGRTGPSALKRFLHRPPRATQVLGLGLIFVVLFTRSLCGFSGKISPSIRPHQRRKCTSLLEIHRGNEGHRGLHLGRASNKPTCRSGFGLGLMQGCNIAPADCPQFGALFESLTLRLRRCVNLIWISSTEQQRQTGARSLPASAGPTCERD